MFRPFPQETYLDVKTEKVSVKWNQIQQHRK